MIRSKKLKAATFIAALVAGLWATSCSNETKEVAAPPLPVVPATGITLPDGFSASIVADSLGRARHLAVTPEGNIYVKLNAPNKDGKTTIMLTPNGGQAVVSASLDTLDGGTGIYIKNGYLYTTSTTSIFRYKLNEKNQVIDPRSRETIVSGLLDHDQHNSKSIVLDNAGNVYVNIGAPSNSCQEKDRVADGQPGSKGMTPCPILDSAGGIWKFKADIANQTFKDGVRYATGLRNVVGLDWNQQLDQLFVMQHGRDKLAEFYPQYFDSKQSSVLPAECMYALKEGDNAGWPYMYYDQFQKKKLVMPEYGGNGKKEADKKFIDPAAAFPGHLAPNGLLFYTGTQFPEKYKNGAFIAFHGSWNRHPEPQAGFFVVFQPFVDGKPSGDFEVFADGFSGSPENTASGSALRRPCGLAQGPDGSIYVTDDKIGGIFKITYGSGAAAGAAH